MNSLTKLIQYLGQCNDLNMTPYRIIVSTEDVDPIKADERFKPMPEMDGFIGTFAGINVQVTDSPGVLTINALKM